MLKNTVIICLVIVIIYLYYQNKNFRSQPTIDLTQTGFFSADINFLKERLNSNSLEELKAKLGEKTLDELIEENEDYETEVDTLTRTKNSLEADLLAQSNAFQSRQREKVREIEKLKTDLKDLQNVRGQLTSEKQQHKGSLERIKLLTDQITKEQQKVELLRRKRDKEDKK